LITRYSDRHTADTWAQPGPAPAGTALSRAPLVLRTSIQDVNGRNRPFFCALQHLFPDDEGKRHDFRSKAARVIFAAPHDRN
jgi:hypothetical protein